PLARDVRRSAALPMGLGEKGFWAPAIHAADLEAGFLILEDLGSDGMVEGAPPEPMGFRYQTAIDALVELHRLVLPDTLPVPPDLMHRIPPYDIDALQIEVELLPDWYLPFRDSALTAAARETYRAL